MEYHFIYQMPVGKVAIGQRGDAISILSFDPADACGALKETPLIRAAARQLSEFFNGRRHKFDLPLLPDGTEFQQRVWRALQRIPFGTTKSYGDIAAAIGQPNAPHAVGQAVGKNPIAIIIPCHRVIAADGGIGGFSSGLPMKRKLMKVEGIFL